MRMSRSLPFAPDEHVDDELCEAKGVYVASILTPEDHGKENTRSFDMMLKTPRKNREIELLTPRESRNGTSCSPDAKSGARAL